MERKREFGTRGSDFDFLWKWVSVTLFGALTVKRKSPGTASAYDRTTAGSGSVILSASCRDQNHWSISTVLKSRLYSERASPPAFPE